MRETSLRSPTAVQLSSDSACPSNIWLFRPSRRAWRNFIQEIAQIGYPYASDGEQLITRTKEIYDGAMPSGNSVAALVLSRLARLTGEIRWRNAADLQLSYLAGIVREYPAGYSFSMLAFLEELWPSAELVCTAQTVPDELTAFLRGASRPALTVLVKTPETANALDTLAPFTAAYPIPKEGARYYLCQNGACAQPVDDISKVKLQLESI